MLKPSPLKHKEKGGISHDNLTPDQHWEAHPFAVDKPGFKGTPVLKPSKRKPVIKGLPSKEEWENKEIKPSEGEEMFFGAPELNYKGEPITDQPQETISDGSPRLKQPTEEVETQAEYDPKTFTRDFLSTPFSQKITSGAVKINPVINPDDTNLLKIGDITLDRDKNTNLFNRGGMLPGSIEEKKWMRVNKINKTINGLAEKYINGVEANGPKMAGDEVDYASMAESLEQIRKDPNSPKIAAPEAFKYKGGLVKAYDMMSETYKTVLDYSNLKDVKDFDDDITQKFLNDSPEFKAIRSDVLGKNKESIENQSVRIAEKIREEYNVDGLEEELHKKYNITNVQDEVWNDINLSSQAVILEKQKAIESSVLESIKTDMENGKYEGYSQEELQTVYGDLVKKEMEPILSAANIKANEDLKNRMGEVYDKADADMASRLDEANGAFQKEISALQWNLIQDDPRYKELLSEFGGELSHWHAGRSDLYTVDAHTPNAVKGAQQIYDAVGLEHLPVVGWLGSPYQIYKSLKGAKTSGMDFLLGSRQELDFSKRRDRFVKNLQLSQNQQWSDDQVGYENKEGDFIKWDDEDIKKHGPIPAVKRGTMGGLPYVGYKKKTTWGESRDAMETKVKGNNEIVLNDLEKIFERRKIEAAYPKIELQDMESGKWTMKELSMMTSEQTVNIVGAITTLGVAPAVIEGASIYERMIQDAAREKFGLGPEEQTTPEQLLEVLNDTEIHSKIAKTTAFAATIIGGLEYVGATNLVRPFFGAAVRSAIPSLLRGQYKKFLKTTPLIAGQSVKGGLVETITEGLQTVTSSTATGHWDSGEFYEAMGQGAIIGTMLPFGGNIVRQSGAELGSLYRIASGKLNSESAEAYFNREFKSAERAFENNELSRKEYDEKVEIITDARNANKSIPKEFKGKDRQAAVSLLIEKAQLEKAIKGKDESLTTEERKRIDKIKITLQSQAEKKAITDQLDKNIKAAEDFADQINYGVTTIREEDGGTAKVVEMAKEAGIKEDVSQSDGFVVPGTNKIIINYERASQTAAVSVGTHEILHGIVRGVLNDKNGNITTEGMDMVNGFLDQLYISDPNAYDIIQKRIVDNYLYGTATDQDVKDGVMNISGVLAKKGDTIENPFNEYAEEYFTAFHDGIMKGEINIGGSVLQDIGHVLTSLFRKKGFKKIKFDEKANGKDVYDFLVNYSKDVKQVMKGENSIKQEIIDLVEKGKNIVGKTVFSKTVQKTKDNLGGLDYKDSKGNFSQDKFTQKSTQDGVIAELPGMVDAQISNLLISSNLDKERWSELRQEAIFGLYNKGEINGSNAWDGRGSLYGFINGRIKYRLKDAFKNNPSIVQDFSQEELNEAMTQLEDQTVGEVAIDKDLEIKKPKINVLKFNKVANKVDTIKKIVKVKKGDTHKNITSKYTGPVAKEIFNVPEKKITQPAANLTYAKKFVNAETGKPIKKGEQGIPEASEAGNIQDFFAGENMGKTIKLLPPLNVSSKDADINELGENVEVSRDTYGVSLGLKNRMLDYFYNPIIKEDGKPKRSQGLTSQSPLHELKPEFINASPETIQKAKEEAGITPRGELNNYNRDIGQFLKGLAFHQAQQTSLSAAQRNQEQMLKDADIKKKQAIKQQTANITAAQSKVAFSLTEKVVKDVGANPQFEMDGAKHIDQLLNKFEKEGIARHTDQTSIDNHFASFENDVISQVSENIMPKSTLRTILRPSRRIFPGASLGFEGNGVDIIDITTGEMTAFEQVSIYDYFEFKINELLAKDLNYGAELDGDGARYKYGRTYGSIFGVTESSIAKSTAGDTSIEFNKVHSSMHTQLWERINNSIKDTNGKSAAAWGTWLSTVGQNTEHPHRLGAEYLGYSTGPKGHQSYKKDGSKGKFKLYEWEHAMPATKAYLYLMAASLTDATSGTNSFSASYKKVMDNFKLIALDSSNNAKFSTAKRGTGMGDGWSILDGSWRDRYFDEIMAAIDGGIDPTTIKGLDGRTFAEIFNINAEGNTASIKVGIKQSKSLSNAISFSRSTNNATRGITVLDFDDTLATTKSGVRAKIPNPDGLPRPQRKAIFLAGGAGSGKGNVVSKLNLEGQGFKVVNSDISLEWLKKNNGLPASMNDLTKEQRSKLGSLQHQSRGIAKRKMMKYQGTGEGVVVDGTGGSIKSMEKLVGEFKEQGYDVSMMFVETSLPVALERNSARQERSLLDKIVVRNHESVQSNKDGFKTMFGDRFMEVNTDNLTQKDAMPTKLTNQMNDFVSSYENRRLDAEEFASEGANILEQGGTFDFSEFNKVVEGKTAPLFNKAMKLQDKFGNKDMFVLTARPAESAAAIFEFLQSNGLNIPLGNITGLGNSTGEAKANWMLDKVNDGYNDFYFADDAIQNVKAVQNMLDQMDVKSKVQQAKVKFSKSLGPAFNEIIESTTGMESQKQFSNAQAKIRGAKTKYNNLIPASAQDFQGLLYNFIGKGKKGEADLAFFKKALIDPFARGINEINSSKQSAANDYKNLQKAFPGVKKTINENIKDTKFTNDQAARVYLWNKAGFDIPGLSKRDLKTLVEHVEASPKLQAYADGVGLISKKEEGYGSPGDYWLAENITSDLLSDDATNDTRANFLAEWQQNADAIFTPENLNKIEAIYGGKFREALEDVLYRMKTGRNRPSGGGRLVNQYMNWVNNSVGAIMFLNLRSASLQTISATNYMNWHDNNPAKAAAAFANQPQFWSDFSMIFNSDYLKQRRSGNQRGINEAELSAAVAGAENKAKAVLSWLLKKGFLPTQMADSFAISMGGASFYRNRTNKYIKEGMTQELAEKQAFLDLQETTEINQQSARPDMISQQQASPLGRLILAFQNTPMQYARIMDKAGRDIINGRGDFKHNVSKIVYYGVAQSILFGGLQSAILASMGDEEEEDFDKKKARIINGMIDSALSGGGVGGKAIATAKNTLITFLDQRDRGFRADHAYTLLAALSFSPPIGSKLRKIYSSIQTDKFNKDVFLKRGFTLDNPIWAGIGNVVEGVTNAPLGRISNMMLQLDNVLDSRNETWKRLALGLGWNTWDLGIKDLDIEAVKEEIKQEKKIESKIRAKEKQEQKKKEKEEANEAVIEENKKKSKKDGICSAISKGGQRCKSKAISGGMCTVHEKATQNVMGVKSQCKKIKDGGKQCGMQTASKSGYCYYHD